MSAFRDMLARRQPLLDHYYGEQVLVTPWLAGDMLAGGPDPSLAAFAVAGILDLPTKVDRVEGASGVTGSRSDIVQESPRVDFAIAVFNPGQIPQANWRLTAIERANAPVYKFVVVEPDGLGRLVCSLLQV